MDGMIIENPINNLGDFVNTVPIMVELTTQFECSFLIDKTMNQVFDLIDPIHKVQKYQGNRFVKTDDTIDIMKAYNTSKALANDLHATQAFHTLFGLDTPNMPIKPQLNPTRYGCKQFDFLVAPFSSRLSQEQLWSWRKWNELLEIFDDKTFGIIGNYIHEGKSLIDRKNAELLGDPHCSLLSNYLLNSHRGCISVVNGISSLCYGLGVDNYILNNQYRNWMVNPAGHSYGKRIPDTTPENVAIYISGIIQNKEMEERFAGMCY